MTPYELLIHTVAFVIGSIAVGRAARLVVHDAYPPMQWLRDRWLVWTETDGKQSARDRHRWLTGWSPLLTCPFCFAPYAAAVDLAWYLVADGWWADAWWVVNVWAAVSYVAAMIVLRDEPPEE